MPGYDNLTALYVNTSLKKARTESHTQLLLNASPRSCAGRASSVDEIHLIDMPCRPASIPT